MSKSSQTIMINITTENYIPGTNKYRFNFSQPLDFRGKKAKLMMHQYTLYNSTFNISSSLGNNTYSVIWPSYTKSGVVYPSKQYDFIIPDGYYSFSDLNTNLQYNMASNYLYLQNSNNSSQVLYFISFSSNIILYKSEIDINYIPNIMPSGYTLPSNMPSSVLDIQHWELPTDNTYPKLILSSGLQKLFGFTTQGRTFPISQTIQNKTNGTPKNLSFLSDIRPILSPTFSYLLTCNFIDSKVSNIPTLFFQIPLSASYGKLISATTTNPIGISINPTVFNHLEIGVLDNNYNAIILNDEELVISLLIEIEE